MKLDTFKIRMLFVAGLFAVTPAFSQENTVDVNLNLKHSLGAVSTFDRNKFVAIHADITEQEWDGTNFTADLRNDFLNGYDVYLGRNTGGISWNLNNVVTEDPARKGFANPVSITSSLQSSKASYGAKTHLHAYEFRNDQILCAQLHPFWPNGQQTNKGWAFSQTDSPAEPFGTASGEYMGRYISDAYGTGGTSGPAMPKYVEVVNEPLYWLVDNGKETPEKVFKFHNVVAAEIRKFNPGSNIQIGGYCAAFPDLEKNDFGEWVDRMKLFMDIAGNNMDYWTIHLYDFAALGGKQQYRKGSNMEATFDMMEQYSFLKFGRVKPFMISEYGAVSHDLKGAWSPQRDWDHIKSVNSMRMQFMERANIINKTIDFMPVKAEWGTKDVNDTYSHRLLRKENEPQSYTGKWVYTDLVKGYQLWSDVKGTRVDSKSTNPDVLTDVYVDGRKVYVILNNLDFQPITLNLNLWGNETKLLSVKVKHLYKEASAAVLDEKVLSHAPQSYTIGAEGTIIAEYTFDNALDINETSVEKKYYAGTYFKPILANTPEVFKIEGVETGALGEAVLRVGLGRSHGKSLRPRLLFNGQELAIPENFRGDEQTQRASFFGVIEVPVPFQLVQAVNTISLVFPESGGYISSLAMQTYLFSKKAVRSGNVAVSRIGLVNSTLTVGVNQKRYISAYVLPENAAIKNILWSSQNNAIASVDVNTGQVTGLSTGQTTILATTLDGSFTASCLVTVQQNSVLIPVETITLSSSAVNLLIGNTHQLLETVLPLDAANKSVIWKSGNESVASVNTSGLITAKAVGKATITVSSADGSKQAACQVTVKTPEPASIAFDNQSVYLNTTYKVGGILTVNCNFHAGSGNTVTSVDGGVKYFLREIRPNWSVEKDYIVSDASAIGKESGSSTANISLAGVKPTASLADGNFYYLFISFKSSTGASVSKGIFPIKIVDPPTGVQQSAKAEVNVFPNPVKNLLNLELPQSESISGFEIISITGQPILRKTTHDSGFSKTIDVSGLQNGMYILKFSESGIRPVVFVKE